jgi:hypothetical protein
MSKLYEYLGLIVLFYANEHEPVHVHGASGVRGMRAVGCRESPLDTAGSFHGPGCPPHRHDGWGEGYLRAPPPSRAGHVPPPGTVSAAAAGTRASALTGLDHSSGHQGYRQGRVSARLLADRAGAIGCRSGFSPTAAPR